MRSEKLIFHIDVNSAFLSWSALERLRFTFGAPRFGSWGPADAGVEGQADIGKGRASGAGAP